MVQIIGTYDMQRENNENLDEFYEAIGMKLLVRRAMCISSPTKFIINDEGDHWNFKIVYIFKQMEHSFKLDEEYVERMINGMLVKSITTLEDDNKVVTRSKAVNESDDFSFERHYKFTDAGISVTLRSVHTHLVAKRFFKRMKNEEGTT